MNSDKIHILLAEDDEDDRFFFDMALKEAGIPATLKTLEDGMHLVEYLISDEQKPIPDIIFLDINMPRMNGMQCLEALRMLPQLNEVPIVMFTTASAEQHMDHAFGLGANRYINKPTTIDVEATLFKNLFLVPGWKKALMEISKENFFIPEPGAGRRYR